MEQAADLEGIMDALSELKLALGVIVAQSLLHLVEDTTGARNYKHHGSEFAKDLMPTLD